MGLWPGAVRNALEPVFISFSFKRMEDMFSATIFFKKKQVDDLSFAILKSDHHSGR